MRCTRLPSRRAQELIRRLNLANGGTLSLVRMREDLIDLFQTLRTERSDAAVAVESLDQDFVHLFSSWFNRGFLVLRRIDWTTPAHILEKIIRYEAVHEISDWDDLRRRIAPADRRCFAFFHPALVDEPLIFVEVALTTEIPGAIGPILQQGARPDPAQGRDDGGVLLDLELPARPCRRLLRQLPDQAGGRGSVPRDPEPQDLRHALAGAGLCRLARPRAQKSRADRHPAEDRELLAAHRGARMVRGAGDRRGGAEAAAVGRGLLLPARQDRDGPAGRSGGAVPSRQRRAARAAGFPRRHVAEGPASRATA